MAKLKLKISILFLLVFFQVIGQKIYDNNLVPNPSFEEYNECPYDATQFNFCKNWKKYLYTTPDYFNSCDIDSSNDYQMKLTTKADVMTPNNFAGFQIPRTGNAYCGIATLSEDYYSYQEYIQTKLIRPLLKDSAYAVSMYVSLSEDNKYANDLFRFCFNETGEFTKKERAGKYPQIKCQQGVLVETTELITDTASWVQIDGVYIASGGEQYLTIGVFQNDMSKKQYRKKLKDVLNPNAKSRYAYYYIDDVSVSIFK